MEEAKAQSNNDSDIIDLDENNKSFTEYNQTKVASLKRVQEMSVKIEDKWQTEATEVTLLEKDEILQKYESGDRNSNYSDLKNKRMMMFKINLPEEYLVTNIKFNFTSIDALKLIYNIEAFSSITNSKMQFLRPLENQKKIIVDPALKFLSINLYSFASSIYIYYQPVQNNDSDGRVSKKNKNVFSYNGPLHDLNAEIQKSNIQANDLDELDNEVAMISRKSPKSLNPQNQEESKSREQEGDDYNTRNFNSIPRNYDDNSENSKSETQGEDSNRKQNDLEIKEEEIQSLQNSNKPSVITSIVVSGAKGLQSKINLIPLFNIKSLFQRYDR